MDREIKFRGMTLDKKWIYGAYTPVHDVEGNPSIIPVGTNIFVSVIPESVGQFIGRKDKKGKEIYKGDWVKQSYIYIEPEVISVEGYHIGIVVFIPSRGFCIKVMQKIEEGEVVEMPKSYKEIRSYRCEVIGNTTENPELLEKQNADSV